MHEMSVTRSIVDACSERANGARIIRVTLEIGMLSCVMPAALQFCYEVAVEGTDLEGSDLEIIRVPGRSRCRDCGADVRMDDLLRKCDCGSTNLEAPRGGDELKIKSMEIEEAA